MPDLLDTITDRVIDPKAYTFDELMKARHIPFHTMLSMIKSHTADGSWEQVWKIADSGRMVKAYRLAK
jgi:hypothetical protein